MVDWGAADDLVSWLEERPDCAALEWRVLLTHWAEVDRQGFRSAAVVMIVDERPFTEAVVDEVLLELARRKVWGRPRESLATLDADGPLVDTAYEAWLSEDRGAAVQAIEKLPDGVEKEG